jgi:hypothetical protein
MNVIFIAPGYPDEMPFFVRGLTRYGGSVFGVSDVPANQLPRTPVGLLAVRGHDR